MLYDLENCGIVARLFTSDNERFNDARFRTACDVLGRIKIANAFETPYDTNEYLARHPNEGVLCECMLTLIFTADKSDLGNGKELY